MFPPSSAMIETVAEARLLSEAAEEVAHAEAKAMVAAKAKAAAEKAAAKLAAVEAAKADPKADKAHKEEEEEEEEEEDLGHPDLPDLGLLPYEVCMSPPPRCLNPQPACLNPPPLCLNPLPVCLNPPPLRLIPQPVCMNPPPLCLNPQMDPYFDADMFFPLFAIDLTIKDKKVQFEPSLETMEETVLGLFDGVTKSVEKISDIRGRVSSALASGHAARFGDLHTVTADEGFIVESRAYIKGVLKYNSKGPNKLKASYEIYKELMSVDPDEYVEEWKMAFHTTAEYEQEILRLAALAEGVQKQSHNEVVYKMMRVSVLPIKKQLLDMAMFLRGKLLAQMMEETHDKNHYISERYTDIQARLQTEANNAEELDALKKFLASSVTELKTLQVCM
jgi:hypothetical protein